MIKDFAIIIILSLLLVKCGTPSNTKNSHKIKTLKSSDYHQKSLVFSEQNIKSLNIENNYTIIIGKLMDQEYVPNIKPSECFKDGRICLDSFYLYKINVQQVLRGEPLKGIVKVAKYQHTRYMYRGSESSIFLIEKINNKNTSKLLNTDYYLEEYIKPITQYCFPENLNKYFQELRELNISNCLSKEQAYGGLKDQLLELTNNNIIAKLRKQGVLIDYDYDFSDGKKIFTESDDEDNNCPNYADLDKIENDINCILPDDGIETYKVYIYQIKKGNAEFAKELIKQEISNHKINLGNVKMNFQIIENKGNDTLYWHYKVDHLNDKQSSH